MFWIDSLNLPLSTQALIDRFLAEQIWKINASYPDTEHDLVVFSDNEFALYSMATALIYSWQMKSSDRESHIRLLRKEYKPLGRLLRIVAYGAVASSPLKKGTHWQDDLIGLALDAMRNLTLDPVEPDTYDLLNLMLNNEPSLSKAC